MRSELPSSNRVSVLCICRVRPWGLCSLGVGGADNCAYGCQQHTLDGEGGCGDPAVVTLLGLHLCKPSHLFPLADSGQLRSQEGSAVCLIIAAQTPATGGQCLGTLSQDGPCVKKCVKVL